MRERTSYDTQADCLTHRTEEGAPVRLFGPNIYWHEAHGCDVRRVEGESDDATE